jgi:hypothetical protein
MLGNYRVAAQLVASRVVLSSTELVSYYHWQYAPLLVLTCSEHFSDHLTLSFVFRTPKCKFGKSPPRLPSASVFTLTT